MKNKNGQDYKNIWPKMTKNLLSKNMKQKNIWDFWEFSGSTDLAEIFLWHFFDPRFGRHIVLWHFMAPQFSLIIFCHIIWTHSFADYFWGHFLDPWFARLMLLSQYLNPLHNLADYFLGHFLDPWFAWLIFLSHYLNPLHNLADYIFGPFSGPMVRLTYIFVPLFGPTIWLIIFLGAFSVSILTFLSHYLNPQFGSLYFWVHFLYPYLRYIFVSLFEPTIWLIIFGGIFWTHGYADLYFCCIIWTHSLAEYIFGPFSALTVWLIIFGGIF